MWLFFWILCVDFHLNCFHQNKYYRIDNLGGEYCLDYSYCCDFAIGSWCLAYQLIVFSFIKIYFFLFYLFILKFNELFLFCMYKYFAWMYDVYYVSTWSPQRTKEETGCPETRLLLIVFYHVYVQNLTCSSARAASCPNCWAVFLVVIVSFNLVSSPQGMGPQKRYWVVLCWTVPRGPSLWEQIFYWGHSGTYRVLKQV